MESVIAEKVKIIDSNKSAVSKEQEPVKGDAIDQVLRTLLNGRYFPLKFTRIEEGRYMFGTKKISAKILDNMLVIRVGGGYLVFEEFLDKYTYSEIKRVESMMKEGKPVSHLLVILEGMSAELVIKYYLDYIAAHQEEKEKSLKS